MKLVNIFSEYRELTLFCRNDKGELEIEKVKDFFPYFYEKCHQGNFKSYKGESLKKMFVSSPYDIKKQCSNNAFEADIMFTKRYMIDKIKTLEKCPVKYCLIDIEVQSDELPNVIRAEQPVSCITVYNSFSKEYKTFFLGEYKTEFDLIEDFINYMKQEQFDVWLSWYVGFDYTYLYNRFPDFAERISPIGKSRWGGKDVNYPAGLSIVDYLTLFKSFTLNKERNYTLDYIANKYLGTGKKHGKVDFSKISTELKKHNIEDVEIMENLEKKFKLMAHYDEIRRFSMIEWEELGKWNSRIIDMLILKIAKKLNIVLPTKNKEKSGNDFEGAYREAYKTGIHFNKGKYDLSGAYMYAIIDLNIDSANIVENSSEDTIPISITDKQTRKIINTYNIKQNPNTLLPVVSKMLIDEKNILKTKRNKLDPNTEEYEDTDKKYNALKTIVLSAWGVMGNSYFRLYDHRVAGMITSIVRDLIWFVEDELKILGYPIEYVDTDGFIIDDKGKDISPLLNTLVKKWANNRFGKELSIVFDYEGNFEKLFILTTCRYIGYIRNSTGLRKEVKGLEIKRKDSTLFMQKFQDKLLHKLMNKEQKPKVIKWIKEQVKEIKTSPIAEIAFPCKLGRKPEEYKNVPIFLRALNLTDGFTKKVGNAFYYIYMKPFGYEEKTITQDLIMTYGKDGNEKGFKNLTENRLNKAIEKNSISVEKLDEDERFEKLIEKGVVKTDQIKVKGKINNVLAFDDEQFEHINRDNICWQTMISRNIYMKLEAIFSAMKWDMKEII